MLCCPLQAHALFMPPDVSFERGPDFFDGVEVRGVSRQEQGGDAVFPESLLDGPCLVKAGPVKNQGRALPPLRGGAPLGPGPEGLRAGISLEGEGGFQGLAMRPVGGDEGGSCGFSALPFTKAPLSLGGVAAVGLLVVIDSRPVHVKALLFGDLPECREKRLTSLLVPLLGQEGFFYS